MNTPEEFWCAVDIRDGDACWEWKLSKDSGGHGQVVYHGKHWRSHRLAWTLERGPIPQGMFVCHHCDNPVCCNPDHLFLGTHMDNMRDMVAKGRSPKGPTHLTPEWREKISASLLGKPGRNLGKHWSDEYKAKMSKALTGPRNPRYGKHHTEETKAKISATKKATGQRRTAFMDGEINDDERSIELDDYREGLYPSWV